MTRFLITGANGLLGQKIVNQLAGEGKSHVLACSRGENRNPAIPAGLIDFASLDITDYDAVIRITQHFKPDCIIHTAAMTNVDACELNPEECKRQNVDATANIIESCRQSGAHLIHLSTDFIFDGKSGPYSETDMPNPLSIYGHAKLDAEKLVQNSGLPAAIVRTVLVYGVLPDLSRSNVVLWALNGLRKGDTLRAVTDQVRTPTLAEDLAAGCILAAEKKATGIYHISGVEPMTIYDLVLRVAKFWELPAEKVIATSSDVIAQPARRPPITGFVVDKARRELGYKPHSFEEGLALLKNQGV